MNGASALPVELWQNILLEVLLRGFFPRSNASLFEQIDVFSHPCKIYKYMVTIKTTLRLVCRTWNDLLQRPLFQVIFVDASPPINRILEPSRFVHRAEIIHSLSAYCLQWPCQGTSTGAGDCYHRQLLLPHRLEKTEVPIFATNLRLLRLHDDRRDPTRLLQENTQLEALWIPYAGFRTAYKPQWATCLSHLHLDQVFDDGNVYRLVLPQLEYIRLRGRFHQYERTQYIYPLDISMPKVTTVYIEGSVYYKYMEGMNKMIFDAKDTIVNLLLSDFDKFPWERLDEFPRLEALGLDTLGWCNPLPRLFSLYPFASLSSISFIMVGIEWHDAMGPFSNCDQARIHLLDIMSRPGKWVEKVVMPFVWREMELLCVNAYNEKQRVYRPDEVAFPCCWACIEYLDRNGIRIEDRNGTSLRKEDGRAFSDRMRTFVPQSGRGY